jgi:hypothetical protein
MSDTAWSLYEKANARVMELSEALGAALGHMKNAQYGLEAGDTKATAIRTLAAGIKIAEAPYERIEKLREEIARGSKS